MREGATDNGQVVAANERRMGKNDTGTKEEVKSGRRGTTERVQKGHRGVSENAVNGRAEEEEQKRYFAWMDSVEDGSYRTPEQKEKLHQRAMKIYQKIRERELQQNNS